MRSWTALALAALLSLSSCGRQVTGPQPVIHLGILEHSSAIPIVVAHDEGMFERHDIHVELKELSPSEHMPALLRGDVDVLSPSSFPVIFSAAQQSPGFIGCYMTGGESLSGDILYGIAVLKTDSSHNSLKDFAGERIGSSSKFTTANLRNVLRTVFGPSTTTKVVEFGDRSVLLNSLLAHQLQGAVLDQPALALAERRGDIRVVEGNFRARYIADPYWSGAGVFSERWRSAHGREFGAFLDSLDDALAAIKKNPVMAREVFSKHFGLEGLPNGAIGMYEYPSARFAPPEKFTKKLVRSLVENDFISEGLDVDALFEAVRK
jgi:ABC-type nitrate/sulfonate/bicarbonate transport system substrate-binding protein